MSEPVPIQPVLPVETTWTQAELNFQEDEPPGLFPENQDSNFGIKRKVYSKQLNDVIEQLNTMYAELFIATSTLYLDEWEAQLGLPVNPTGLDDAGRRSRLLARMKRGAFTDDLRNSIIESYLIATFGDPLALYSEGIGIPVEGIPLYGEPGVVEGLFRVYDAIENYTYEVWIKNTNTPDIPSLQRELERITPAGITFTIDNTRANILDYTRAVIHDGPGAYWRLGANFNNYTTLTGLNGTALGGLVAGSGNSLPQNTQDADGTDFDGTDDYLTIPDHAVLKSNAFSVEAWVHPDMIDATARSILSKGPNNYALSLTSGNVWRFGVWSNTVLTQAVSSTPAIVGTYHLVGVCDGVSLKLYVNGVLVGSAMLPGLVDVSATPLYIGGIAGQFWNGVIDEVAFYEYPLTEAQVKRHYNVGINSEAV
jgi:hypothetical protein